MKKMLLALLLSFFASACAYVPAITATDTFTVTVDCNLPADVNAGKYSWADDSITPENFPESGCKAGMVEVTLVDMGCEVTTEEALAELDRIGLRAVTLPELLVLGAQYPDLQRSMVIVAVGSGWRYPDGDIGRPVLLSGFEGKRLLLLFWRASGGGWDADYRFAAVRK